MAQLDFARAYDSVRHAALLRSMQKRCVPEELSLTYIREARRAAWRTTPVRASVGLRQNYSTSPMLFRWVLSDCLVRLAERWESEGKGMMLQAKVLTCLVWAEDLWLWADSLDMLNAMHRNEPEVVFCV